jgi:hypothetical protein
MDPVPARQGSLDILGEWNGFSGLKREDMFQIGRFFRNMISFYS